ncbi:FAD-dependent monooxygenase [Actinoplanes sp. ATCC 53533]|uniref:FAD-dependent monooxygenase n=1 Tax=Actinoplanes sp. ATCC 53533 TaxID=1288362 RepID=UPI001F267831|nr:FAD-dependent monooxygenase [Actinoplanes sp. ATCC 53533]
MLRTSVLVVGSGVTGSVLALELAHHGVASIVVERASRPQRQPDLNLVPGRSMELLRRLGLSTGIREHDPGPDHGADVVWSQGLDQLPVLVTPVTSVNQLRRRYATSSDGSAPVEPYALVAGTELTGGLRDAVRRHPLIELREGWTFTDLRLEQDGTIATVLAAETGVRHVIEASYLAGCDGAQSTVRRCLGVPLLPFGPGSHHCTVYFRSSELAYRPDRPSTIIAEGITLHRGREGDLWIGHLPLPPGESTVTDAARLVHERLGIALEPPEILGMAQWDDSLGVATDYSRGTAYLVGEAAHRFVPPGASVGTCIGDAVDLGWKLAAAINGWGGPTLLASYQGERRRQALLDRELLARAFETRRRFCRLSAAGASREFLADVLRQEASQMETSGTGLGGGHPGSPVVWQETGARRNGSAPDTTLPGTRPPAVRLPDGGQLFDRLGPQFTLVDLSDDGSGTPLVASARARGIPTAHLAVADRAVRARWESRLVLVRPDQHIAWRTDGAPSDWDLVLDVVTGQRGQNHVNT